MLGPPEDFYRILEPHEFETDVEMGKIEIGIETAEELLDSPKLRDYIIHQLAQDENTVTVLTNTKVVLIMARDHGGYAIDAVNTFHGGAVRISAGVVVNASWYNISKFNKMLGISSAR